MLSLIGTNLAQFESCFFSSRSDATGNIEGVIFPLCSLGRTSVKHSYISNIVSSSLFVFPYFEVGTNQVVKPFIALNFEVSQVGNGTIFTLSVPPTSSITEDTTASFSKGFRLHVEYTNKPPGLNSSSPRRNIFLCSLCRDMA